MVLLSENKILNDSQYNVALENQLEKKESAEERREFLNSLLRHNLRDKTIAIQGYHELLQNFELPEEVKKHLKKAKNITKESLDMIEKVEKLLKVEEIESRKVNLNSILDTVIVRKKEKALDRGIRINFDNVDCRVQGGHMLEELFSNLLENAIRHSGCENIRISGQVNDDNCVISVEDDGEGIPDEIKGKVFKCGYKRGRSGGFGLGLYLVKEIAEGYGGRVEVKDSKLGGARLDVYLKRL